MESFEKIVEQYQPMIYKIIHSLHIYKNEEEFYQIGLIGLWEASETFEAAKGNFTSYSYKFIKGRMLIELAKMAKYEERFVLPTAEFWETEGDYIEEHPCETLFLLSHCDGLTDKQLKWVLYTFIDDLSVGEIAAKENVTLSAVKQWREGTYKKLKSLQLT